MTTGTFYLHTFCSTVVFKAILIIAFGFSHEVDMLDVAALMEYYGPVWGIVSLRRVDIESI